MDIAHHYLNQEALITAKHDLFLAQLVFFSLHFSSLYKRHVDWRTQLCNSRLADTTNAILINSRKLRRASRVLG